MPQSHEFDATEARLIQRVQFHRDRAAFDQLVIFHQSAVRQFLRKLCNGDPSLADDLAQETFFKAFIHLGTYRGEGRFLSWLFKIAYQHFVHHLRRNKDAQKLLPELALDVLPNHGTSPDSRLTLQQLLPHLGKEQRAALVLHYQYGLSHREIADTLTMPLGTVKTHLRRGKETLLHLATQNTTEASDYEPP